MNKSIWMLFFKMVFVSFYLPLGSALVPALAFAPVGVWGFLIDGCMDLDSCLINPLLAIYGSQQFLRVLMFLWGCGLVVVLIISYQNLKPEIHQWFRKFM